MINRCLYCYQPLLLDKTDFHAKCSKRFFGTEVPPVLDFSGEQMQELAKEIVGRSVAVTGVQPKLSLTIEKIPGEPKASRLTIVGLWGNYILKPPTADFIHLPENEDLTMHLSEHFGIPTGMHSLIRLRSGELAYITKRFERNKNEKLHLEDMCQLTENLTENKYRGSMEQVGKQILKYSSRPGFDAITFFETALFCFLTGNADMHLKNFALLTTLKNEVVLSPAYDLLNTKLAMPDDKEEAALTINGKKRKITKRDFDALANSLHLPEKSRENSYRKFAGKLKEVNDWIAISFLTKEETSAYKKIIASACERLSI